VKEGTKKEKRERERERERERDGRGGGSLANPKSIKIFLDKEFASSDSRTT